jgi:hypothetical protein
LFLNLAEEEDMKVATMATQVGFLVTTESIDLYIKSEEDSGTICLVVVI